MGIRPHDKLCSKTRIEKYILRKVWKEYSHIKIKRLEFILARQKAFDVPVEPYLPEDILWRQKEQFSDGVGYSWIDGLIAYATEHVSQSNKSPCSGFHFPSITNQLQRHN